MNGSTPHYLLFSQTSRCSKSGRWRFALRTADGSEQFEATDVEPGTRGERLDLLTVVRALESLDQPSRVTLVGCNPYIRRGVQYGLPQWRVNGWRWEFFGQLVPVKNGDLWQRMERLLQFHRVEYRSRRLDPPHEPLVDPKGGRWKTNGQESGGWGIRMATHRGLRYLVSRVLAVHRWRIRPGLRRWQRRVKRSLAPAPWGV